MKKIQYARPELVEPIREALNLAPDTPLREKLDRLEAFCKKHPNLSKRFVCTVAGVNPVTLFNHTHRNKRGKTISAEKRRMVLLILNLLHPDKSKPVNMGQFLRQLDSMRSHVCLTTLRKILNANGYATLKVNQNG